MPETYKNKIVCWMQMKIFKLSEMYKVHFTTFTGHETNRTVCPECKDHPQGDAKDVLDCHNEFTFTSDLIKPNGEREILRAQCCCYSEAHGKQEKRESDN